MDSSIPVCNEPPSPSPPLIFDESPMPAEVDKTEDVVEVPISDSPDESRRVPTVSDFVETDYKADFLHIDQPAQIARLTDPAHVQIIRAMVREGRCASKFSAFSVAGKNLLSKHRVEPPPLAEAKPAVLLFLIGGFHRRSMSQTVAYSEAGCAGFAKNAPIHFGAKQNIVPRSISR